MVALHNFSFQATGINTICMTGSLDIFSDSAGLSRDNSIFCESVV